MAGSTDERLLKRWGKEEDLRRLVGLVQENQYFFGDPPAGESCIRLAADKLEELINSQMGGTSR